MAVSKKSLNQRIAELEKIVLTAEKEKKELTLKSILTDPCLFQVVECNSNAVMDVEDLKLTAIRNPFFKRAKFHDFYSNGEPVIILRESEAKMIRNKLYGEK